MEHLKLKKNPRPKRGSWMNAHSTPAQRFLAVAHKTQEKIEGLWGALPRQARRTMQEWCAGNKKTGGVKQGEGKEEDLSWVLWLDLTRGYPLQFSWRYFVVPFFDKVVFNEDRWYYTFTYAANLEGVREALRMRPNAVNDEIVGAFFEAAVPAVNDLLSRAKAYVAELIAQKPVRARKARA